MLVLSRKVGQSLLIDGQIRVTILEVGGRVQIGVEAPPEVRVLREEIAVGQAMEPVASSPRSTHRGPVARSKIAS